MRTGAVLARTAPYMQAECGALGTFSRQPCPDCAAGTCYQPLPHKLPCLFPGGGDKQG